MLAEFCTIINSEDLKCSWFFEVFYLGIEQSQILKDVVNILAYVYRVDKLILHFFIAEKLFVYIMITWV